MAVWEGEAKARNDGEKKRYLSKEAWEKLSTEEREDKEKAKAPGLEEG